MDFISLADFDYRRGQREIGSTPRAPHLDVTFCASKT